jgi:hypothetical protein
VLMQPEITGSAVAPSSVASVIHHGAGGGPVAGPSGRVFGINCTASMARMIRFISRIDEISELNVIEQSAAGARG